MFIISSKSFKRRTHTIEVLDVRFLKGMWKSPKEGESEEKGCQKQNISSEIKVHSIRFYKHAWNCQGFEHLYPFTAVKHKGLYFVGTAVCKENNSQQKVSKREN